MPIAGTAIMAGLAGVPGAAMDAIAEPVSVDRAGRDRASMGVAPGTGLISAPPGSAADMAGIMVPPGRDMASTAVANIMACAITAAGDVAAGRALLGEASAVMVTIAACTIAGRAVAAGQGTTGVVITDVATVDMVSTGAAGARSTPGSADRVLTGLPSDLARVVSPASAEPVHATATGDLPGAGIARVRNTAACLVAGNVATSRSCFLREAAPLFLPRSCIRRTGGP